MGGLNEAEGTVEICFESLWGLIDESGWGLNDARVVCEQLGYGTAGNITTGSLVFSTLL